MDGQRAFFTASADPLGTNPTQNCQLFSVDVLGANLRQVTHFQQGGHPEGGCVPDLGTPLSPPPGCVTGDLRQDPVTGAIVFVSQCDPFGANPYGAQIFAMRPDGTGLRQLTHLRGFVTEADGTDTVELADAAYSAFQVPGN